MKGQALLDTQKKLKGKVLDLSLKSDDFSLTFDSENDKQTLKP